MTQIKELVEYIEEIYDGDTDFIGEVENEFMMLEFCIHSAKNFLIK